MGKKGTPPEAADALIAALAEDHTRATLEPRARAILGYALKLTLTPGALRAEDLAPLREAGLDDRAIHDVCAITAYFAFVNRIADGLGVELEPRFGSS